MIVNGNSSIIGNLSFKLIDDARVIIYNRNRFIIQATGVNVIKTFLSLTSWHIKLTCLTCNFFAILIFASNA